MADEIKQGISRTAVDGQPRTNINRDLKSPQFRIEDIRQELEENGVSVISNVVSAADCDKHIADMHEWLAKFGDGFPVVRYHCLIEKYRIAHMNAVWQVRLKSKPVFAKLWGTEKLMTSMDAIAIGQPPEQGKTAFHVEGESTLHLDQTPARVGLHAYQGSVYLEEASEDDWCFVVIKQSNKFHDEFFKQFKPNPSTGHRPVSKDEIQWYQDRGCRIKRIAVPKGGMVLWDSRTVHAGAEPIKGRQHADRWRYMVIVCMALAIWASEENRGIKQDYYNKMRMTAHWPCDPGIEIFDDVNDPPYDITEMPDVAKTTEARLLASDLDYDFADGQPNGPDWKPVWK